MIKTSQGQNRKSGAIGRLFDCLYRVINTFSPAFAFIMSALLFILIFKANDVYPFGKSNIAWCDADQQFIPLLCDFKDILSGKQGFFYSFQNAGGMNFYGVFFFNLSSPFSLLVVFFDKAQMSDCFNLMTVLKISCAALTFAFLLKDRLNGYPALVIFFSVLYAFSGYTMMYYQILQWLDVVYVFPFVLLGLEKMTEGKSFILYSLSLLFCVVFQFYLSYVVVIFVSLYAVMFVITNKNNAKSFCFSFILGSLIAALLSAIVLLPCFMQYLSSMRTSDIIQTLKTSSFYPSGATSYPTFFCLAFAFAFAVYYAVKHFKSHLTIVTLLCVVPVFCEPIAKAWQTFNYMAFPTRYAFVLIAIVLLIAAMQICEILQKNKQKDVNLKKDGQTKSDICDYKVANRVMRFLNKHRLIVGIVATVCVLAFSILFSIFAYRYYVKNQLVLTKYSHSLWGDKKSFAALLKYAVIPLIAGGICLLLSRLDLLPKIAVYALIAALVVVECVFSCNVYMISAKNDAGNLKKAALVENAIVDDVFFRVKNNTKLFHVNYTGAMGYGSMSHYTSLNDRLYMHTAKQLGYSSYWMEVNSDGGTIFTDALLRNKYTLYSGSVKGAMAEFKTNDGKRVSVKQNEYCFPFGFYIKDNAEYSPDEGLERWKIQNNLFEKLTGMSNLYVKYQPATLNNLTDLSTDERFSYSINDLSKAATLEYKIDIVEKTSLYFDLFDEYTNRLKEPLYSKIKSVIVRSNGAMSKCSFDYPTQSTNGTMYLGTYSSGTIQIIVTLSDGVSANSFGVFSVSDKNLQIAINELIGGDFNQKPNGITGKIDAPLSGYLFLAVPYNKGFSARINGEKADISEYNGFMTVPVGAGKNVVELDFTPSGFKAGLFISIMGAIFAALYFAFIIKKLEKMQSFKLWLEKVSVICVFVLGVIVIAVIYLFPLVVNLTAV